MGKRVAVEKWSVVLLVAVSILFCSTHSFAGETQAQNDFQGLYNAEDNYRLEIAGQIEKHWNLASADTMPSGLMTSIVFRVMPDGEIKNIFVHKKSGNDALDASAYDAIAQASPVKPFPGTISSPFIQMGINFSPKSKN